MRIETRTRGRQLISHSGYWSAGDETINDHYDGDDEKQVNETATDVYHEEPENPQDEKNHRDRPKHVRILDKGWPAITRCASPLGNCRTVTAFFPRSARRPLHECSSVSRRSRMMVFVESLSPEQDPGRSYIVSDVDEEQREIAASPQ